jgi:hypothetical protein
MFVIDCGRGGRTQSYRDEPITVVTPFTIAQPRSDPDDAVAGADNRGPAPCAALRAQIMMEINVTKEIAFIMIKMLFVLSGG